MAKRFTDTGKWDKAWFRKLTPELKCIWIFLCDRCDHAGVWEIDYEAMAFFIGQQTLPANLIQAFGDKITQLGPKRLLINTFAEFQYGDLNPDNRVHKSVLNRLEKLTTNKDLISPLKGAKDKDKDKDKEKDKDSLKGGVGEKFKPDLESLYRRFPRKQGKSYGLKHLKTMIKGPAVFVEVSTSLDNYLAHLKREKTEPEFIMHFSTWVNEWRDWLDPAAGTVEGIARKKTTEEAVKEAFDGIASANHESDQSA